MTNEFGSFNGMNGTVEILSHASFLHMYFLLLFV